MACCKVVVECSSAGYIYISFGITGPIVVSLKMEFCLCYARGRKQCCGLFYEAIYCMSFRVSFCSCVFQSF